MLCFDVDKTRTLYKAMTNADLEDLTANLLSLDDVSVSQFHNVTLEEVARVKAAKLDLIREIQVEDQDVIGIVRFDLSCRDASLHDLVQIVAHLRDMGACMSDDHLTQDIFAKKLAIARRYFALRYPGPTAPTFLEWLDAWVLDNRGMWRVKDVFHNRSEIAGVTMDSGPGTPHIEIIVSGDRPVRLRAFTSVSVDQTKAFSDLLCYAGELAAKLNSILGL